MEAGKLDGKRHQKERRFAKLQDAIDAYNSERGDRYRGVQISPSEVTLRDACDTYRDGGWRTALCCAARSPRLLSCSERRSSTPR